MTPVTILAELASGSDIAHVRSNLAELGGQLERNAQPELTRLIDRGLVHFMSFFVIDAASPLAPAYVVFELDYDGTRAQCCRALAESVPESLGVLFGFCRDFPGSGDFVLLLRFLREHERGADAFYAGAAGRSVSEIRNDRHVRQLVGELLRDQPVRLSASELWATLQRAFWQLPDAALAAAPASRPFLMRWGLHPEGARKRIAEWLPLLGPPVLSGFGLGGFGLALVTCSLLPPLAAGLLLAPPVLASALAWGLWWRERPVHANRRSRQLARQRLHRAWRGYCVAIASGIGLAWLSPALALLTPPALSLAIGGLGLLLLGAASAAVYVAAGRGPALLFGAFGTAGLGGLVTLNLFSPLVLLTLLAAAASGLFVPFALLAAGFLLLIRRAELRDQLRPFQREPAPIELDAQVRASLARLTREARDESNQQNHLVAVSLLKAGPLRRYALRAALRAIQLSTQLYFNQGELGGVGSIHSARFVLLPDRESPRLLFTGNYDGGFAHCLDAVCSLLGTTAIWSNTEGFPESFFLLGDGARDAQRFHEFGRRCEVASLGWYSAYRDLSTRDIAAGTATRDALNRVVGPRAGLLRRLGGALFGPLPAQGLGSGALQSMRNQLLDPLDEAACDAALKQLSCARRPSATDPGPLELCARPSPD